MRSLNKKNKITIILGIFIILQPFLDCFVLYDKNVINFFHFSPTTIFRTIFIGILFITVFFNNKTPKKNMIIYCFLVLLYTVIHVLYCSQEKLISYSNFTFSISNEILYIIRMLLPLLIFYITKYTKITANEFFKIINWSAFIISTIIIVLNLTKLSIQSYDSYEIIKGNIFDWFFNDKYESRVLASKGWFNSANQISGLMMMLFPLILYSLYNEFSVYKFFNCFNFILSMLALGTRTSSYGWILVLISELIIITTISIINKNFFNNKNKIYYISSVLLLLIGLLIMNYSPLVHKYETELISTSKEMASASLEETLNENSIDENESNELLAKKIENRDLEYFVSEVVAKEDYYKSIYPIADHKIFWTNYITKVSHELYGDNRNTQSLITKDLDENNKTNITPLIGYGYTRFINAYLYLEHDIIVHYYTIGILGILLLLMPYFIIVLKKLILILIKKDFDVLKVIICESIIITLLIGIVTGHILDELICTIYLGFITGYLDSYKKGEENEKN